MSTESEDQYRKDPGLDESTPTHSAGADDHESPSLQKEDTPAAIADEPTNSERAHAPTPVVEGDDDEDDFPMAPMAIYVLYVIGIVTFLTGPVGVIMAYFLKGDAPEWVKSHYQMQIRTFWIGVIWMLATFILSFVLIGFLVGLIWVVWLVMRSVTGAIKLQQGKPIQNPTSWGFMPK